MSEEKTPFKRRVKLIALFILSLFISVPLIALIAHGVKDLFNLVWNLW